MFNIKISCMENMKNDFFKKKIIFFRSVFEIERKWFDERFVLFLVNFSFWKKMVYSAFCSYKRSMKMHEKLFDVGNCMISIFGERSTSL